jgi:hypothetical protein
MDEIEENYEVRKGKTKMRAKEVTCSMTESARYPRKKLGAINCEGGNVEVQWNNVKKCMLDTMNDLVGKSNRKARKP